MSSRPGPGPLPRVPQPPGRPRPGAPTWGAPRPHPASLASPSPTFRPRIPQRSLNRAGREHSARGRQAMASQGFWRRALADPGWIAAVEPDGTSHTAGYLLARPAMIISGGANIYPAEVEAEIIMHPQVADVAVFGIPDEEWGEAVLAVVQPADGVSGGPDLAARILASLEGRPARMKWPKAVEVIAQVPRDPRGELLQRRLR